MRYRTNTRGTRQRSEGRRIWSSPPREVRIVGEEVREDFEGYIPAELRIVGAVHLSHAALADLGGDFVDAEAGAWAEGHGWKSKVYNALRRGLPIEGSSPPLFGNLGRHVRECATNSVRSVHF